MFLEDKRVAMPAAVPVTCHTLNDRTLSDTNLHFGQEIYSFFRLEFHKTARSYVQVLTAKDIVPGLRQNLNA